MSAQAESGRPPDHERPPETQHAHTEYASTVNLPPRVQREPSQQDLEIARQLQHFQAQGTDQHESTRTADVSSSDAVRSDQHADAGASEVAQHNLLQAHIGSPAPSDVSSLAVSHPGTGGQICTNCGTTKTPLWRRSPAGAVICNACGLYYKARNQMRPVGLKRNSAAVSALSSTSQPTGQAHDRGASPTSLQGGATYVSADQSTNGTCPGGGRCNGTGGHEGCNGCPAYNNRISKTAQVALRQSGDNESANAEAQNTAQTSPQTVIVACQNCGTTITPLWRRDEAGNAICNACGLYYKLHGQHRPVQMKKAEIKRRKRVVPASAGVDVHNGQLGHDSPEIDPQIHANLTIQSINTQPVATMEPRTGPGPIPVDFTDAFRYRTQQDDLDSQTIPVKRNFSAINADSDVYPHPQNVSFSAINAVDSSTSREASMSKEARRAELQKEAEKMRQLLEAKEKELAALNDDV